MKLPNTASNCGISEGVRVECGEGTSGDGWASWLQNTRNYNDRSPLSRFSQSGRHFRVSTGVGDNMDSERVQFSLQVVKIQNALRKMIL